MKFFRFVVFFLVSCSSGNYEISEKERVSNQILKKTSDKIAHDLGVDPFGSGGRAMYQVEKLALMFRCEYPIDVEQGRRWLIAAVQELMNAMNEDERIRPYLARYPVGPESVEIMIYSSDRNGNGFGPNNPVSVIANQGILRYRVEDPADPDRFLILLTETYQEALAKLANEREDCVHQADVQPN